MLIKYDIIDLFELVESRPCLWERSHEYYNNKVKRNEAWEEIFKFLVEDYEEQTKEQKEETGKKIIGNWRNIRDSFMRSLRTKHKKGTKNYVYYDNLKFLLNTQEEIASNLSDASARSEVVVKPYNRNKPEEPSGDQGTSTPTVTSRPSRKATRSQRERDGIKRDILHELKRPCIEKPQNSFFSSFEDYVVDMTESEKLELHITLLNAIMTIKSKRT